MKKTHYICCLATAMSCAAQAVWAHSDAHRQHGAHVHGQAQVTLAALDGEVSLSLSVPAGDILGFERAPQSSAESEQIAAALADFKSANWLQMPAQGQCEVHQATAHTPLTEDDHSGHADIHVDVHWRCESLRGRVDFAEFFVHYDSIHTIELEWLSASGAGSQTLTAQDSALRL